METVGERLHLRRIPRTTGKSNTSIFDIITFGSCFIPVLSLLSKCPPPTILPIYLQSHFHTIIIIDYLLLSILLNSGLLLSWGSIGMTRSGLLLRWLANLFLFHHSIQISDVSVFHSLFQFPRPPIIYFMYICIIQTTSLLDNHVWDAITYHTLQRTEVQWR